MATNSDNNQPVILTRGMGSDVGRGIKSPSVDEITPEQESQNFWKRRKQIMFARFSFLRSSAFRMGVLFWLLFTLCFGVSEYLFYATLQDRVLHRIDQSITDRFVQANEVYNADGLEAMIQLSEDRSLSPMSSVMGFHLSTPNGDRIAGNVPTCVTELGWDVLVGEDLGLENDSSNYRFYTNEVGGNILSLGKSLDDVEELRRIALICLLWTLVASTSLAFVVAWYCAHRAHKRIDGISTALDGVAAGNLNARLPMSSAHDDIDQLSVKINSSLDRLRQSVDGMRQVSSDIAHDLKTPLNRLHIKIEEASTKSRAGECVGDDLDDALNEAQAINGTFEALLRIAQIEAGARKSQFKYFDLSGVLETVFEVYSPVVDEHQQRLIVDIRSGQSLPMFGDRSLVLQLLVNLIENSIHHCGDGVDITLSAGELERSVWFRVADSGPGIPNAEREKVFQRLYRLENSRTTQGTGLGLSLVKAIADLHCGTVLLEDNNPGLAVQVCFDKNCPLE